MTFIKITIAKCVLLILSISLSVETNAQVINGGFELFDNDENNDGAWDDWYPHSIEYAAGGWHNSPITGAGENSCDHIHTLSPIVNGTPRTGVGCARFAAVGTGFNEYFYGTTNPLIAGQEYSVSFWIRKDYLTSDDAIIGAAVSESPAVITWVPFSTSIQPQVTVKNVDLIYQQVKYCFTAQNSVVHYINFGALLGYAGNSSILYFIDDVSITAVPQGTPLPTANLTAQQNNYCYGDIVSVDGSLSTDETGYTWEVFNLDQGSEQLEYSSGLQTGQAGTLDINSVIGAMYPGDCYRVYLTVDGPCPDKTFIDFCIYNLDAEIDFIDDGDPVCENTPVNLEVTGDNGYLYTWSTGDSGIGTKNITVYPTQGNSIYTVTVTTPAPDVCVYSESINLNVHSQNNLAPWMDGVNGTGNYTFIANSSSPYPLQFSSTFYNDNPSENLIYEFVSTNLPYFSSSNITLPPSGFSGGGTMIINFGTGFPFAPTTPPGFYYITVSAEDNNACNPKIENFTFYIKIICDYCPMCIYYENRGPGSTGIDLPIETKAGKCIEAGFSQTVNTGTDNILFQAGQYIALGSNFSAGAGYQGVIEPTTCVADCEDCCDDWAGFTYDPIQNYMNFDDGNPATSMWQLTDVEHPFCAFGAKGFDLEITNQWGSSVHSSSYNTTDCCQLWSPAPQNPVNNSSIWWDGYTTNFWGNQVRPSNGTYFYIITLYGCNGTTVVIQDFITILGTSGIATAPNDPTQMTEYQKLDYELAQVKIEEMNILKEEITLSPNPASETIQINGIESYDKVRLHILDAKGQIIKVISEFNGSIDVSELAKGVYYTHIYVNNHYITKKFVKL